MSKADLSEKPDRPAASAGRRPRLALLVNTIAPYRLPIYTALAETFETVVLHGGKEPNRSWEMETPELLQTRRVWTWQISLRKQTGVAGVWDRQYVHLNLGLLWALPSFRPDVILSNELGFRTLAALVYATLAGVPLWVWWGGTPHSERHTSWAKRLLRKLLVPRIRRWITYGTSATEYLGSAGAPRARILQIQNCIPELSFRQAAQPVSWLRDAPRPVLLSVGQLIPRKGLDKLVDACGRLAQRGRSFILVLVGEGPEREALQRRAEQAGISFYLLPNQSQSALHRLYRSADAFIFPTMEDIWGLVVNEALWAGLPVLSSKFAGCAGEIVPAENVFDPTSTASFDGALEKIFDGTMRSADTSRMLTSEQVSRAIVSSLLAGTPSRGQGVCVSPGTMPAEASLAAQ